LPFLLLVSLNFYEFWGLPRPSQSMPFLLGRSLFLLLAPKLFPPPPKKNPNSKALLIEFSRYYEIQKSMGWRGRQRRTPSLGTSLGSVISLR
jgi:hypothetical protein